MKLVSRLMSGAVIVSWVLTAEVAPRRPMPVPANETTNHRWLGKEVLESRLLDDMEQTANWVLRGKGEMGLTAGRFQDGRQSLRLSTRAKEDTVRRGKTYGGVSVTRQFGGEDWTRFNRISFWVYPDLPGFHTAAMVVMLQNEGEEKVPGAFGREGLHYINLENHRWNRVVWEIANLARDKVTGVVLQYTKNGHEPEASGLVTLDFDHLTLERVAPDHFEGWNVAPGTIAFSHAGYAPGMPKTAFASGLVAREFQLIRQDTKQTVLSKPVRSVKSPAGDFEVLDFSEAWRPGTYILQAGDTRTRPFRIGADIWRSSILKALNFYYVERCGVEIPGSHRACHRDWQSAHGDKRIAINGGWHDAGDLTQHIMNTGESVYALFHLAERLRATGLDAGLYKRVLEEAQWGLDWVLKTSFHDGFRSTFSSQCCWTDGVVGTKDDVVGQAKDLPYENFVAAAAEAIGARVLRDTRPALAARSLATAREDWRFAVAGMKRAAAPTGSLGGRIDTLSTGILASVELFRATGEKLYGEHAATLAEELLQSQRREFLPGVSIPLTGFFYNGPAKDRLLHYEHPGHEQGPMVALAALCDALPDHKDWARWYGAVVLHTEYYMKPLAQLTEPYHMLPAGIYHEDEYLQVPEDRRESFRGQVLNGMAIGGGYRVRRFPVWFARRGNAGTGLSQTKAVSAAAGLRGDLSLAALAEEQMQWLIGRNPFVQSLMYGEGYDYPAQYTVMSGDIAGALPVGIETRGDGDVPYWPPANCYNYKEVWIQPVARWIYIMADLLGPAVVHGRAGPNGKPVRFVNAGSGAVYRFVPDAATGRFRAVLPAGRYTVGSRTVTVLPGAASRLDLRPGSQMELTVNKETRADGAVVIRVAAQGTGRHRVTVRTDNLKVSEPTRDVMLNAPGAETLVWSGTVGRPGEPWIAVVVPDGDLSRKQEVTGRQPASAGGRRSIEVTGRRSVPVGRRVGVRTRRRPAPAGDRPVARGY